MSWRAKTVLPAPMIATLSMVHPTVQHVGDSDVIPLPVALQLFTVRAAARSDFAETVRRVAELGYDGVEFAGYGGLSAENLAGLLAEAGLRAAGTHVSLQALEEDLTGQIEYCAAIGAPFLVLASLPADRRDAGSVEQLAPFFDTVGLQCRDCGITFAYHNHEFDFAQLDGHTLLDLLLEQTDPDLVKLELDVYWAVSAGVDAREYLRRHSSRIPLIHVKDMSSDGRPADVGEGTLDLPGILFAAREAGAQWLIVENDEPGGDPLDSARLSLDNLKKM
jgi:sugar phosphate isomerase/epimerase